MYSKISVPNNEYNLIKRDSLLENCIEQISYGNKSALTTLYESTKSSVYGFALSILKNESDAEDVLQEVYIKIYENANTYTNRGKPLAWILTITKNLAYMKLRKRKNTVDIDEMHEIVVQNQNVTNEDRIILNVLLKNLSDEERNIIILHANSGFKYHEIAQILNLPLSTVLSKYHRAIKKIKKLMDKEDI